MSKASRALGLLSIDVQAQQLSSFGRSFQSFDTDLLEMQVVSCQKFHPPLLRSMLFSSSFGGAAAGGGMPRLAGYGCGAEADSGGSGIPRCLPNVCICCEDVKCIYSCHCTTAYEVSWYVHRYVRTCRALHIRTQADESGCTSESVHVRAHVCMPRCRAPHGNQALYT